MARNRIIKVQAFRSKDLARVEPAARWTFAALWCLADDHGVLRDDLDALKADVYLRDPEMTPAVIESHLFQLAGAGLICRYQVNGQRYLHSITFGKHQTISHPSKTVMPECGIDHEVDGEQMPLFPLGNSATPVVLPEGSGSTHPKEERRGEEWREMVSGSRTTRTTTGDFRRHRHSVAQKRAAELVAQAQELQAEADRLTGRKAQTRIPDDFAPSRESIAAVAHKRPDVDQRAETERFVAHWRAKTGKAALHRDWQQAWRNWMTRSRGQSRTAAPEQDMWARRQQVMRDRRQQ